MTGRPVSIRWFERLYLASIALGLFVSIATWDYIVEAPPADRKWVEAIAIGALAVSYILSLVLWSLIVRHRSRIARWVLTILTVLGVASTVLLMWDDPSDLRPLPWRIAEGVAVMLGAVAIVGLFMPDARRWFKWEPEGLTDTFS